MISGRFLRITWAALLVGGQAAMLLSQVPSLSAPRLHAVSLRRGMRRSGKSDRKLEVALAMSPALVRGAVSRLLDTVPEICVIGHGEDEKQIRKILDERRPQVLLLDYEATFPIGEGVISSLRRAFPETRVLVISRSTSDDQVERVLRAGASGLVGKQEEFETLVRAIQAVAAGEFWASRRSAARALERLTDAPGLPPALEGLTRRELQIVNGVALGLQNKEIGRQLNITESTVKSHLNAIFRRLKITGRVSLAMLAQENRQLKG